MKIKDIIQEGKSGSGPLSQRFQRATVGLNKFRDNDLADRFYELYRVMMAAAATDGTKDPDVDPESWIGRYNIATPFTEIEQKMLEKSFKGVGSEWHDLNHGDLRSQEIETVNKQSPVSKPKRNKYGV